MVALWLAEAPLHRHTSLLEHMIEPDDLVPHSHLASPINRFLEDNSLALTGFPGVAEIPGVCMEIPMHGGCVVHLARLQ